MFYDWLDFAWSQFDHRREGLRPAVSVDQFLGANQSEEREHGVFFQNRQISRWFVAHRKNHHLKRFFSELRLDDSTTAPGLGPHSLPGRRFSFGLEQICRESDGRRRRDPEAIA